MPSILAVGRFVEKKGLRYLIEALAMLQDNGCEFRAILVGEDGPEAAVLRDLIARHGLGDRVTMQGPVDHCATEISVRRGGCLCAAVSGC